MTNATKGDLQRPFRRPSTFQTDMDAANPPRKPRHVKATPLRPPADGCRWSRSMVPRRSLANDGPVTLLDAFEGRRMLVAYYFMWHAGRPAPEQCEGCTFYTRRSASCRSCTLATSPTPRSAKARTKRAPATATSWAGRCPGIRPSGLARHPLGWTPGGHDAHRLLPATRIRCLRDLLDDEARRRGDGQQLSVCST